MQSSDNKVIYIHHSQLPRRRSASQDENQFLTSTEDFPASCSQNSQPMEIPSSEFIYYDGTRRTFTAPHSKNSRKRKFSDTSCSPPSPDVVPRPMNSFLCARSMLQPYLKKMSKYTIRCSNIMGAFWKLESSAFIKRYFRYIAFVESARHNALYPGYKYQPKKKKTRTSSELQFFIKTHDDWNSSKENNQLIDNKELSATQKVLPLYTPESVCSDFSVEATSSNYENQFDYSISQVTSPGTLEAPKRMENVFNDNYMISSEMIPPILAPDAISTSLEYIVGEILLETFNFQFPPTVQEQLEGQHRFQHTINTSFIDPQINRTIDGFEPIPVQSWS